MRKFLSLSTTHGDASDPKISTAVPVSASQAPSPAPSPLPSPPASPHSAAGATSFIPASISGGVRRLLHVTSETDQTATIRTDDPHPPLTRKNRSHSLLRALSHTSTTTNSTPLDDSVESHRLRGHDDQVGGATDTEFASQDIASVNPLKDLATAADRLLGSLSEPLSAPVDPKSFTPTDPLVIQLRHSAEQRKMLLYQFLRARNGSSSCAIEMLQTALAWRASIDISTYLRNYPKLVDHPAACFPLRVLTDPAKHHTHAVVYGLPRLLEKHLIEKNHFLNASISFFEHLYFSATYPVELVTVILDFRGWSLRRNTPYRSFKDGIQLVQSYYPDRLSNIFLLNYPSTMRGAYAVVSPMIDAGPRQKIVWIPSKDPAPTLSKYIPLASLPKFLGGQLDVEFPGVDLAAEWRDSSHFVL